MRYVVVSKPECPWCDKAKALLHENNIDFINISPDQTVREFFVAQGLATVPQVYVDGKRIGGYEDLKEYIDGGDDQLELTLG